MVRADIAVSRRYVVENGINESRAFFINFEYSLNMVHSNSIVEVELN